MAKNKKEIEISSNLGVHSPDWLGWVTIVVCLWFIFLPRPYEILFLIVLSLPMIGLIFNGLNHPSLATLVSINWQEGKKKYDVSEFISLPGIAILIRILMDFEVESYYSLIKVGSVTLVIMIAALLASFRLIEQSNKNRWVIYLVILANVAIYSFSATYGINCIFDNSEPRKLETTVIKKYTTSSSGRNVSIHYYIEVEPWGHKKDPEKISVTQSLYLYFDKGSTVVIDLMPGFLDIPWYYIDRGNK